MKKTLALFLSLLMVVSIMAMAVSAGVGNTWTAPQVERFDMNNSSKIAYRFATQGTGGLLGIKPYLGGTAGVTFSVKAYSWNSNYEATVAQEPLTALTGLTFDGTSKYQEILFDSALPAGGDYLIEICDVVLPAGGWALCNYIFSANDNGAFRVYKNGVAMENTLQWQLVFEEGGWYKGGAALPEDTETSDPAPKLPEQVTYVNTWGSGEERFDGNGTAALAYRFATQGSGKLIGINPQIAGEPGKFDLLVYKWDSNYETTIAGAAVLEMKEIEFDKSGKWSDYNANDTTDGPAILFPEGLEGGEYLFVMTNFKDTSWAICNYITEAKTSDGCSAGSFKVYKNGECMDKNLKWQLIFEQGGWIKTAVLAADAPAAPKLPAEVTYANTWGSGEERFDGNGTAALAYRFATQGSGKLIGINPQIAGEPGKFDLLVYKWDSNYVTTVAGAPVLEMKEIEFDKSGKWTDYDKNDTTDGPAIFFPEGLEAGEYLFVMTNFKDTSWAICNYITDAKTNEGCSAGSFKVYKNGECMDKNLKWQLIFEKGGYFKTDVLAADAPVIVPPAFGDDSYVVDVNKFDEGYKIAGSEHEGVEDSFYRAVGIPVVVVLKDGTKVLAMDYSESGVGFVRFFGTSPADACKPVATYGSKFTMSYRVFLDVADGAGSLIFRDRLTDSKDNAGFNLLSVWSNGAVEAADGQIAWGFSFGEWVTVTNVYDLDAATVSTYANDKLLFTQNLPTGASGNVDWSDFCYQALGKNANDSDTGSIYLADIMWERGLNAPETPEPETSEPETTEPEPETSEPETSEPATTEPVVTEPTTQAPATTDAPATSENTPVPPQGDNAILSALALILVSGLAVSFVARKKK